MGMILVYGMKKEKEAEVKDLAKSLGHEIRTVEQRLYGESLGYVAGITGFKRGISGEMQKPLGNEMMVFSGFAREDLDPFLNGMKERGIGVALKAMLTPYNIHWNSRQLYEELVKEHKTLRA